MPTKYIKFLVWNATVDDLHSSSICKYLQKVWGINKHNSTFSGSFSCRGANLHLSNGYTGYSGCECLRWHPRGWLQTIVTPRVTCKGSTTVQQCTGRHKRQSSSTGPATWRCHGSFLDYQQLQNMHLKEQKKMQATELAVLHLILSFVKVIPILNPQDLVSIVAREGCKVSGVWCYKQAAELLLHVCATVQQRRICTARFLVEFDLKATGVCVMRTRLKPWWWS